MMSLMKALVLGSCLLLGRKYISSELRIFKGDVGALITRRYVKRLCLFVPLFAIIVGLVLTAPFLHGTTMRVVVVSYLCLSATSSVIHRNITGQYRPRTGFLR